jgi:pyrroline-5-carboxylate reductase
MKRIGHLVLVGAGKMGGAMLRGWLKGGLPPAHVTIVDPHFGDAATAEAEQAGISVNPEVSALRPADVLVLAVKPQMLDTAADTLAGIAGPETLVISVIAGKTVGNLKDRMPRAQSIVRCMPNTPAAVGRGITGAFAASGVSEGQQQLAQTLLESVGRVEWVASEGLIDAVTAVSGSGPAYVFYLTECLAAAGVAAGLPEETAARLARATVEGAGELMFQDAGISPAQLRINVTSPGGTTAAALAVLMAGDGMTPLMRKAVLAARQRAEELAG